MPKKPKPEEKATVEESAESEFLGREALLAMLELPDPVRVALPKGHIYIRPFTTGMRDHYEVLKGLAAKEGHTTRSRAIAVYLMACDKGGSPIFCGRKFDDEGSAIEPTEADIDVMDSMPATVLEPIIDAAIASGFMDWMFASGGQAQKK